MKHRCNYTRLEPIEKVIPNPRNPNTHPEGQIELLAKIIDFQGWRSPIVVSKSSGFIVRGHGRLLAAQRLGLKKVPIDVQTYDSEAQEWADLVADNRIAELADMDRATLKDLIEELDTGDLDLDLTGFDQDSLEDLMSEFFVPEEGNTDEDEIPEQVEVRTKPGDLWELGDHRLLCGDCTERQIVQNLMKKKASLVFTDPPYGVNVKGGRKKGNTIAGDLTQTAIPFSFELAVEVATLPEAQLYFCGGEQNLGLYAKLFDRFLHQLPKHLIWVKEAFVMKPNGYHNQYEMIFYGFKEGGGGSKSWLGERTQDYASDIWEIHRDNGKDYLHPTQKPVALPSRAIRNHSRAGEVVYEPFVGSGSTLMACEILERICYAIEIDPHYCDVAIQRWEDFTGKKARKVEK